MTKVVILRPFRDKFQFTKTYKVGEEVETFDEVRIADLAKRGLVEIVCGAPGVGIDISKAAKYVIEAISACEDSDALKEALSAENAKDKPRKSVVEALESRIAELNSGE